MEVTFKAKKRLKKSLPLLGIEPGSTASKSSRMTITPHGSTYEEVSNSTNIFLNSKITTYKNLLQNVSDSLWNN